MADDDPVVQALRLARSYLPGAGLLGAAPVNRLLQDPALQTGPFPQWPSLPPMPQPPLHYLEQGDRWRAPDPMAPEPTPLGILMALAGVKGGMKGGTRWFHGSPDPNLTGVSRSTAGGLRNTGGAGAISLTPYENEARDVYGPNVYGVESRHQKPFVWDVSNLADTVSRARSVMPNLQVRGDSWLGQREFFDALRRAGYDAIETRSNQGPAELNVLDPSLLTITDKR